MTFWYGGWNVCVPLKPGVASGVKPNAPYA
jgi:hypothetical protein